MMAFGSGKSFSERANTLDTSASGRLRVSQQGQFWWFIIIIFPGFLLDSLPGPCAVLQMSEGDCTGVKARQEGKDQWNFGRRPPSLVISHSLLSLRIFIPSASWLGPTPILSPPLPLFERVYSVAHLSACCETIERGRTVARPKESGACRSLLGGGRRSLRHRPTIQKTRRARFWIGDLFTTTDGE
jgi:hypothetical protein